MSLLFDKPDPGINIVLNLFQQPIVLDALLQYVNRTRHDAHLNHNVNKSWRLSPFAWSKNEMRFVVKF